MTSSNEPAPRPFRQQLASFERATNNEDVEALQRLIEPLAKSVSSVFEFHEFVIELDTASLLLDIDQGLGMDDFMVFLSGQLRSDFMNGEFSEDSGVSWSELALSLYRAARKTR